MLPTHLRSHARSGLPTLVSYGLKSVSEPIRQSSNGSFAKPGGMAPDMLLRLKLIFVRFFKVETEGGIGPVKLLPSQ